MGGTSKQSQTSQASATKNPWEPAIPGLQAIASGVTNQVGAANVNGIEDSALNRLSQNARGGNPYAPQVGVLANDLLAGGKDRTGIVSDAYSGLQNNIGATARGDYVDPANNPFYSKLTSTVSNDIQNRISGMFAGAGRDFSGAHIGTMARGISEGVAPVFANQWNKERDNHLNAASALYGAGNTTGGLLSGMDQTAFGNRQAGVDAAGAALRANDSDAMQQLAIEAMRRGIPMDQYAKATGILGPMGGLGGTQFGNSATQGEHTMSPAQQAWGWMNAFGNLNKSWG